MKSESLSRSDVLLGIVGVPDRSVYAPENATDESEASFVYPVRAASVMKPAPLVKSDVSEGIVGVSVRSLYEPDLATDASEASFA